MIQFENIYASKRVLITGHTGFKGSWLTLWLSKLGAEVAGLSSGRPTTECHWDKLGLNLQEYDTDVREFSKVSEAIDEFSPEIVFHLAAQPLVRKSYRDPLETWSTNVMGTASILESCRLKGRIKALVIVTTDKCYKNLEQIWPYREIDELGGFDPYSASKAATEILVSSYRDSYFRNETCLRVATARAGNVIGGGDWSEDRLIPDAVRAVRAGKILQIRSPLATRPWQHVLEPLSGYLLLGQHLLSNSEHGPSAWNFGPSSAGNQTVKNVLEEFALTWPKLDWTVTPGVQQHEANLLHLDSTKAKTQLNWNPVWSFKEGVKFTAQWYREWIENGRAITDSQLRDYINTAHQRGCNWISDSARTQDGTN